MLDLKNVSFTVNDGTTDLHIVKDVSLTVPDGKLIALLGPSGCGKSTTLYMISGLQKPTSGKIFFGENEVTNISTENRGIGLVFQNYALYPHMTVKQNILFPLTCTKSSNYNLPYKTISSGDNSVHLEFNPVTQACIYSESQTKVSIFHINKHITNC
jgi:multiple sugar transport system ATP-binding protein